MFEFEVNEINCHDQVVMQGRSPVFSFFAPVIMAGLITDEVCHEQNRSYLVGGCTMCLRTRHDNGAKGLEMQSSWALSCILGGKYNDKTGLNAIEGLGSHSERYRRDRLRVIPRCCCLGVLDPLFPSCVCFVQ